MKKEVYDKYCRDWKRWKENKVEYYNKLEELRKNPNATKKDFIKLRERYGYTDSIGPWTVIDDPKDLLDPNFILPGFDKCFLDIENTDMNIPYYFGRRAKDGEVEGVVVGYGYDSGDDYLVIEDDSGRRQTIMINSKYTIL